MTVAVVADAHLGGPGGTADRLVAQLERLSESDCEAVVLLGDLFQVWVGDERYETPEISALMKCLAGLRSAGVRLHYIEGNRDFFIVGSRYAEIFDSVGTELTLEIGGRNVLFVHGDGINARDYQYRFWRRISKNFLTRWAMFHFPRRLAARLINGFENELSKTNFKHKRELPRDVIVEYARRRLAEGHDALLLGHFHEPFRHRFEGGEVVVLDAWFRGRRVEWLDASGLRSTEANANNAGA